MIVARVAMLLVAIGGVAGAAAQPYPSRTAGELRELVSERDDDCRLARVLAGMKSPDPAHEPDAERSAQQAHAAIVSACECMPREMTKAMADRSPRALVSPEEFGAMRKRAEAVCEPAAPAEGEAPAR